MNKLMNKVKKNKKGFTLIELIVVIAILGILVLLAAPRFLGYTKDANVSTMQADAKVLSNAALVYNIEKEGWPVEGDEDTIQINGVDVKVKALEKTAFEDHVQTLKNDIDGYKMVTEKTTVTVGVDAEGNDVEVELQEGDILYVAGVEDREGDLHYGVNVEIKAEADGE